jgi:hypothetical protein
MRPLRHSNRVAKSSFCIPPTLLRQRPQRLPCSLHNAESKIDHHPHFLGSEGAALGVKCCETSAGDIPEELNFANCV